MKIECYLSGECGSEAELRANIETALSLESTTATVTVRRIESSVARALELHGSPSVLINGRDIQPSGMEGFG